MGGSLDDERIEVTATGPNPRVARALVLLLSGCLVALGESVLRGSVWSHLLDCRGGCRLLRRRGGLGGTPVARRPGRGRRWQQAAAGASPVWTSACRRSGGRRWRSRCSPAYRVCQAIEWRRWCIAGLGVGGTDRGGRPRGRGRGSWARGGPGGRVSGSGRSDDRDPAARTPARRRHTRRERRRVLAYGVAGVLLGLGIALPAALVTLRLDAVARVGRHRRVVAAGGGGGVSAS